ncbi:MAG: M48 family metallopeptidase [Burkholderiales bacterium]|nr:M48 family metallopeptidase [Burkholderiales bacterium]
MQQLDGIYFDGHTSVRHEVKLMLYAPGVVRVTGRGVERIEPMSQIVVSEAMGGAPRLFTFADSAVCEVPPQPGVDAFLSAAGHAESLMSRVQSRWSFAIASAVLLVAVLIVGYRVGLPWAASAIAARLPASVVTALSDQTLQILEQIVLEPSTLPVERRERIAVGFARLTGPDEALVAYQVLFRASPHIGPNALALPSGTIIVTDELVRLTQNDDEILAVLAHELGHVQERHGLRLMVESSIVGFVLAWYVGEVSSIAAGVSAALLQAHYSRDYERAADTYAARLLEANRMSPALLADMLEKLEASHGELATADGDEEFSRYLSSHPATRERIAVLRGRQ